MFSSKMILFLKIFAPLFLIFNILLSIFNPNLFIDIATEDKFYEYFQFFVFLAASVFAFKTSKNLKSKKLKWQSVAFLFLAILLGLIAFEEISWGQRIIGIDTPDFIKEINLQNELTIHNTAPIQDRLGWVIYTVGFYGAFSRIILKKFFKKHYQNLKIFTPPTFLWLYFFTTFVYNFSTKHFYHSWYLFTKNDHLISRFQEVAETLLSIGFMVFTIYTFRKSKKSHF